jgi:ketosteroid isomerase-like protein
MASTNVAIVRRAYEAWNAGDIAAATEVLDPSVEWRMPPNFPEADTYRGIEEVTSRLTEFLEQWEEFVVEIEELLEAGDDVVALTRFKGRSKKVGLALTGVSVDAQVWTLRDGRVTRVWMYGGTEDALEAAGLATRPGKS